MNLNDSMGEFDTYSHLNSTAKLVNSAQLSPVSKIQTNNEQQPWVFVPKAISGYDTSRVLKKKQHDVLIAQVKALEHKLKEQRRINEKKQAQVLQERQYLQK